MAKLKISKNIMILIIFLAFVFIIQSFYLGNLINNKNIINTSECNIESLASVKLDLSQNITIENIDLPLFPEISNFKCLNKIYYISESNGLINVAVGQNKFLFFYVLLLFGIINYFLYLFKKDKSFIICFYLISVNLYLLLIGQDSLFEIFLITLFFLLPLIREFIVTSSKYFVVLLVILIISIFNQQIYLSKEVIGWEISTFLTIGQDIFRGYLPYENQLDVKGPLIFYIYSIVDLISNGDYRYVKLINDLFILTLTFILFLTVKIKKNLGKSVVASLLFISLLSIEYFGEIAYSEQLSLIPIAFGIFLFEKEGVKKVFSIGILFSLSTLINHGTVIFFLSFLVLLLMFYKDNILKFLIGFSVPHLAFLILYLVNDLLKIYLISNLQIPLNYSSKTLLERVDGFFSGFIGIFIGIYKYNALLSFTCIVVLISIIYTFLNGEKNISYKNNFYSLKLLFIGGLLHIFIAGPTPNHYIFLIYIFCLGVVKIKTSFSNNFLLPMTLVMTIILLNSFGKQSLENIKNFNTVEENYILKNIAEDIIKTYKADSSSTILALDHHLILYYLDKPNLAYINHPTLMFLNEVNIFDNPENETKEDIFIELLSKQPDFILCNSSLYFFCREIENYNKINQDYDIFMRTQS